MIFSIFASEITIACLLLYYSFIYPAPATAGAAPPKKRHRVASVPAHATAGAAPPKKKAPRSECAIDTDRELPVFEASNMIFPIV